MNKKAYIFLMDGIIAVVILTVGFLLISSNKPDETTEIPISMMTENTMSLFSNIKLYEICDFSDCGCSNDKLSEYCASGYIENKNQTLLDYFGELYNRSMQSRADELFYNITIENDLLRQDIFGVEFKINDETIYLHGINKEKSKDLISSKRIIFGYYEVPSSGIINYWGPYLAEVNVWQE